MKMPTDLIANEAELKRYLFSEMSEDEHTEMEERLFLNDDLFYEAVDLENRLVDLYVQGKLPREDEPRFERSLATQPERKQKVANAAAINEFIAEERPMEPAPVKLAEPTIWERLSALFRAGSFSLGYGTAGLVIVLAILSTFLVLDNRRKAGDIARLQTQQNTVDQLESDLATARAREGELQAQIDDERETSGDLSEELQSERTRRERIEGELAKIRRDVGKPPPESIRPIIAALVLSPITGRGGNEVKDLAIVPGLKRVALQLILPGEGPSQERYSVSLNARQVARDLAPRLTAEGKRSISFSLAPKDLEQGVNRLSVTGAAGNEVSKYLVNLEKR